MDIIFKYFKTKLNNGRVMTRGFTLVELLVAIGIIAILFAVVLVAINPAKRFAEANNARRQSDVNNILESVVTYSVDQRGGIMLNIPAAPTCIGTGLSTHSNGGRAIDSTDTADTTDLSALWHMDGNASDSNPTLPANPATLNGSTSWSAGKFGQSLTLDGSSGFGQVSDDGDIVADSDLDIGGDFTLMTWVKPNDTTYEQTIISKGSGASNNYFIRLVAD